MKQSLACSLFRKGGKKSIGKTLTKINLSLALLEQVQQYIDTT